MKPLHLNLAARPYRDYRPVYAAVVVASLLIAFMMLNNVETYYRYVNETQTTRSKIADLERRAGDEQRRAAAAEAQVRGVNVAGLDSETRFINARLAERAFSWSELLDRLEGVLPEDVRIRAIVPTFDKSGRVHLEINCEGKSTDSMIVTLNRFNRDPHFADPFPHAERVIPTGGYGFTLGVDFKPSIARMVEK